MPSTARHPTYFTVLAFALFSLGADPSTSGCKPLGTTSYQDTSSNPNAYKPWCHTDPPIFCAAFCSGFDQVTFSERCWDLGADVLELEFEKRVMNLYNERLELGEHLCTQADPLNFVTPCQVGVIPQEHPNQDHEVCEPVPPNCPMF